MKRFLISLALLLGLSMGTAITMHSAVAAAETARDQVCQGVNAAAGGSGGCTDTGDVNKIIKVVINTFSVVVGVVAVIMIIVAGFKYITSGGDSGSISSAKNTLIYAIVGLVVVALAQGIVRFVLSRT